VSLKAASGILGSLGIRVFQLTADALKLQQSTSLEGVLLTASFSARQLETKRLDTLMGEFVLSISGLNGAQFT